MKDENRSRLKKQLVSGGVYIALAAAVVAVTTGTVVSMLSGKNADLLPKVDGKTKYSEKELVMPKLPDVPEVPDVPDAPVSDSAEGINAEIKPSEEMLTPKTTDAQSASQSAENVKAETADFGYPGYVKPCDGYISREYSDEVLVYSPTMYDYRAHLGCDIAAEAGTPVKAVSGGTVTDISADDMLGTTVTIESADGLVLKYCNLSAELPKDTAVGNVIQTGSVIAGVGQTALCEAAEAPHLHLEAARNGEMFDPAGLFEAETAAEAANAVTSEEID